MNQRIFLSAALAAISLPAQIYTVAANTEPDSLNHTNGNKVVSAKGRLHAFHAKGGQIYYSVSADARIWTPPVSITTGITPAVAVASDGTIGVAFYDASLHRCEGDLAGSSRLRETQVLHAMEHPRDAQIRRDA